MKSMSKIVVPGMLSLFLAAPVLAQTAPGGSSQSSATSGPNGQVNTSSESHTSAATQRTNTQATYSTQPSMSHDTTLAIQRRLEQDGLYHGNVDGQWGPDTQAALSDFQKRNNLNVTGQADARTLDALKMSSNEPNTTPVPRAGSTPASESHSSSSSKSP